MSLGVFGSGALIPSCSFVLRRRYAQVVQAYLPDLPRAEEDLYLLRLTALQKPISMGHFKPVNVAFLGNCDRSILMHLIAFCRDKDTTGTFLSYVISRSPSAPSLTVLRVRNDDGCNVATCWAFWSLRREAYVPEYTDSESKFHNSAKICAIEFSKSVQSDFKTSRCQLSLLLVSYSAFLLFIFFSVFASLSVRLKELTCWNFVTLVMRILNQLPRYNQNGYRL